MKTLRIEILNPKALQLLKNLADLDLIAITEKKPDSFSAALAKLRAKAADAPDLDEITKEVEAVRRKRYGR